MLRSLRAALPQGHTLPYEAWRRRHHAMVGAAVRRGARPDGLQRRAGLRRAPQPLAHCDAVPDRHRGAAARASSPRRRDARLARAHHRLRAARARLARRDRGALPVLRDDRRARALRGLDPVPRRVRLRRDPSRRRGRDRPRRASTTTATRSRTRGSGRRSTAASSPWPGSRASSPGASTRTSAPRRRRPTAARARARSASRAPSRARRSGWCCSAFDDETPSEVLQVNRAMCEITGRTREDLRANAFRDVVHPEDATAGAEAVRRTRARRGGAHAVRHALHPRRRQDGLGVRQRLADPRRVGRARLRDRAGAGHHGSASSRRRS